MPKIENVSFSEGHVNDVKAILDGSNAPVTYITY